MVHFEKQLTECYHYADWIRQGERYCELLYDWMWECTYISGSFSVFHVHLPCFFRSVDRFVCFAKFISVRIRLKNATVWNSLKRVQFWHSLIKISWQEKKNQVCFFFTSEFSTIEIRFFQSSLQSRRHWKHWWIIDFVIEKTWLLFKKTSKEHKSKSDGTSMIPMLTIKIIMITIEYSLNHRCGDDGLLMILQRDNDVILIINYQYCLALVRQDMVADTRWATTC